MWKGAFTPLSKHRDFEHNSFFEHSLAGGAILGFKVDEAEDVEEDYVDLEYVIEEFMDEVEDEARRLLEYWVPKLESNLLTRNPINGLQLENPGLYYSLGVVLSGKVYDYLIPGSDGKLPTRDVIEETLSLYIENYVEGGRNMEDYI